MDLSRRQFLAVASAAAAATGLPLSVLGPALAEPARAATTGVAGGHTTLDATIQRGAARPGGYRPLVWGPGEGFLVRGDLGAVPAVDRATRRRSLLYFGQQSDTHLIDAQSPARVEPTDVAYLVGTGAAFRPQETLTTQALDALVRATNANGISPVTGAPMAFSITTGDVTDSNESAEMRWFVDIMDGRPVTPNTGKAAVYEGVQRWFDADWAYHPEQRNGGDAYAAHGFPELPGLLDAAVTGFQPQGSAVPWYAVFGNHDLQFIGTLQVSPMVKMLSGSRRKAATPGEFLMLFALSGLPESAMPWFKSVWEAGGGHQVTPDPVARELLDPMKWMQSLFNSQPTPGPVGHGFTGANLASGETWWSRDEGAFRFIGLDTCNHFEGSEGGMIEPEFKWLEQQLIGASRVYFDANGNKVQNPTATDRMVVLFSHHNSWTMDNYSWDPTRPYKQYYGKDLLALLDRFPNVVLWANGHTHEHKIVAHKSSKVAGAGFWEVNSPSCIDAPQQGRLLEIVDNRDGTLSIFTIAIDHAADPDPGTGSWTAQRLASTSRELAFNDPFGRAFNENQDPLSRRGDLQDRNCELVLKAPFDPSVISDTSLAQAAAMRRSRLVAKSRALATAG